MLRSPPLKIGRLTLYVPIAAEVGVKLAAELVSQRKNQRAIAALLREDVLLLAWTATLFRAKQPQARLSLATIAEQLPELVRPDVAGRWSAASLDRKRSSAWHAFRRKAKKFVETKNFEGLAALLQQSSPNLAETKSVLKRAAVNADPTSQAIAKLLSALPSAPSPLSPLAPLYNFAYGLSHEINNPLTNISLRAQSLHADETNPDKRRKLAVIHSQALRAYEMIADLMLFAHPPTPQMEELELAQLVTSAVDDMQDRATAQGTKIVVSKLPCVIIRGDAVQLRTAFRALLQNSLEALQTGGKITIAAKKTSTGIELTFRDTGPGIPAKILPHIFNPYFSGREAGRGLGLGLSKCWRIVELHGGKIEAKSSRRGAVFRVIVPSAGG